MRLTIEKLIRLRNSLSGLIASVKKYDRQREKATDADLHYDAMMIEREAHEVHCQCVEAGLAPPYEDDYYGDVVQRDGWHELIFHRRRP